MNLLGFNFEKVLAERKGNIGNISEIKVNTNIDLSSIEKVDSGLFNFKETILGIKFKFELDYSSDLAKIELKGNFLVGVSKEESEKIISEWKNNNLNEETRLILINLILKKSTFKALELEDQIGIPTHIAAPSIDAKEKNQA